MTSRLADLLTAASPDLQPGDLKAVSRTGMSGWVASRLPAGHALRPALEPARLGLLARQMLVRRTLLDLLRACAEAGLESVLLKGFMLAEFAYPVPGTRPYGDVDLLIRPEQLPLLLSVAGKLGWREDGTAERVGGWTHEIAHFYSPDKQIRLDVHRYVSGWLSGPTFQVRRLTQAVWEASESVLLEDVPVRRPSWADCALQLVLGRSWSGDAGIYKPADYTDLQALAGCPGVTPILLAQRARQLGAVHTWQAFLAGCDPWRRHFEYESADRARLIRRAALRDGAMVPLVGGVRRLVLLPRVVWRMGLVLPDVLMVGLNLRRPGLDPRQRVQQMTPPRPAGRERAAQAAVAPSIQGVRWLTRLLYPRSPGVCVPKSLAIYRALRRAGYPAVYVSGVRRGENGAVEGHAWVEGPDGPLDEYEEVTNRYLYQIVFEVR